MRKRGNPLITNALNLSKNEVVTDRMSVQGAALKSFILMLIVAATFLYSYKSTIYSYNSVLTVTVIIGGILGVATSFMPKIAKFTGIIYAAVEGFALGAFSNLFNQVYPGIAAQAVIITILVAVTTFIIYGLFPSIAAKTSKTLYIGLISLMFIMVASLILGLFGISLPIYGNGLIGIIFSIIVIGIAVLSLIADFDNISKGARYGMPKYMEWYCAFGLTVTLIWLYTQILQLLAQINSRD